DIRTFMDPYAEKYGNFRYVWKDLEFYVHPRLAVGDVIELHYYRRLGQLDALYSVVPENYDLNYAPSNQPLLEQVVTDGTFLFIVQGGTEEAVFDNDPDAQAFQAIHGGTVTQAEFVGREAWNWLRDANERICIFAAMVHVGSYLMNDAIEQRYMAKTEALVAALNAEDKFRKAKGGNHQINVNTGGLI